MYAITGATGHVGGATARALLEHGAPVRVVVRDPAKGEAWSALGAEVAVADYTDEAAMVAALAGCRGAFVMLPTLPSGDDAEHRRLAESIAAAVAASGVAHVVMLSSIGADLPAGTGPIRWLHHLEQRLRATGATLTALRSPHFQEKVELVLGAATEAGVYPVFADSADVAVPMVATRDIGAAAAAALLSPPAASEVVDLDAPSWTEHQVAELLGAVLRTQLQVVTIPQAGWLGAMTDAGVPAQLAAELVAMYDADNRGLLVPRGDRTFPCLTPLDETLRQLVPVATP